ncbi:MAG: 30S ribosomal protein S2 [Patescibacteria group bacterium]
MKIPSIEEMLQAGVHFGHNVSRWHPKMKDFIFTSRNRVHVIDLEKTLGQLETVLEEVKNMAAEGKKILFVSTKPQARQIVRDAAISCEMPYLVERWLGGMLTNFAEIKKLIRKFNTMKEKQAKGELVNYTKKEQLEIARELQDQEKTLAGLSGLTKRPDVIFVPSVQKEKTAIVEANRLNIPIVGVCDTNANPTKIDYVIAANDDAVKSIELIVKLVAAAVKEGNEIFVKKQKTVATTAEKK